MSFYVFRCKHCGKWGVKEVRKSLKIARFRCAFCLKIMGVKHTGVLGLALLHNGPYESGLKAAAKCAE
ncbi:unnamed protein product, partial [marine sediment metagenome]